MCRCSASRCRFLYGAKISQLFHLFPRGHGSLSVGSLCEYLFVAICEATAFNATAEIAPVVEEVIKLLSLLFYLTVFEPEPERIRPAAFTVAAGFATFENICYLIGHGAEQLGFLLIRGFGTGAMHIVCGAIMSYGIAYVWQRKWMKLAGTLGLLGISIGFHGIYNLLIAYGGRVQYVAYALPLLAVLAGKIAGKFLSSFSGSVEN